MALSPITPRDRLQRLVDLARKTLRYWWLIALFTVVGVGISLVFASLRTRKYDSYSTLFYQERIQSSLLQNREDTTQRNIGDRFRELLLARQQIEQLVVDPKLGFETTIDPELLIERIRQSIRFESRGANAFRITYTDNEPARAKAVTEKLTKLLQEKDESLRNELAQATVAFALQQKEEASVELRKQELLFTEFLAKHPEFISDTAMASDGASIRAANKKPVASTGNPRLQALDRQRDRIMARLNASPDAPPVRVQVPASAEKLAAERQVDEAQREAGQAAAELEDALSKYTDKHPSVIKAQERVASARAKLARAQAAVPPNQEIIMAPATQEDRDKLKTQLVALEAQIAQIQANSGKATPSVDTTTNSVVQLETQHADLRRSALEARERAQSLADSVFRAQIDANQKLAEAGGRLSVIDPAFKPLRPTGTGKSIFLIAGMVLFLGLGSAIAIGLAVIDDRIYRRSDIDTLGLAVLAIIPRAEHGGKKPRRKGKS